MVEEYFRKQQESLLDEKLNFEKEYTKIVNQIIETEKFIELLEEKSDPNFESFTPREVNVKNRNEIKNLLEVKKKLQDEKNNLKIRIDECKAKIEEFQLFLHSIHEEKTKVEEEKRANIEQAIDKCEILKFVSREKTEITSNLYNSILKPMNDLSQRMKRVSQFIDLDRERAKMELQQLNTVFESISTSLEKTIGYYNVTIDEFHIKEQIEKYVNLYNEEHSDSLHISYEMYEDIYDNEVYKNQAIFNMLVCIIKNCEDNCSDIIIKISLDENTKRSEIEVQLVCNNTNDIDELKDVLLKNSTINIYANLLSIVSEYKIESSSMLCITLKQV